jgi:Transglutaminase-like superfamily/Coenzyme PQQ synthesis protein D (PqqD)
MTSTTIASTQPFALVAGKHRDGSVLLSAANDRIFKLNGTGALTWTVLEQSRVPLCLEEVVQELCVQFERLNAAAEMQFDVSAEQLKQDTSRFIKSLTDNGLLQVVTDASRGECYRIKADVSGTTATTLAQNGGEAVAQITSVVDGPPISPSRRQTLTAFFGLIAFDLLLKFRGFAALVKKVENWPTTAPHTADSETCRRVCAMVNRAQVYYPKKAMCLQHSAVVTCLLRRQGVPAEMVLAAQEFPPKGHAWVEVEGRVVNDFRQVKTRYRELRRI